MNSKKQRPKSKQKGTRSDYPKTKVNKTLYGEQKPVAKRPPQEKKEILAARDAGGGTSIIFGVLPVLEALRAGNRRIDKILIAEGGHEKRFTDIMNLARQQRVLLQKVPRESLGKYLESDANHQGVLAFIAAADYYNAEKLISEVTSRENCLAVILDGVEDPRNLGAILRSVEGAGADGVFIPERRAVGLTETVAKSSAGAAEYVKLAKIRNVNNLIDELKENNIWVVGASGDAKISYTDWDWTQPSALVLGSEGSGLHRLTAEKCDVLVKIPLLGKIESLNVSVAAGVILFEAVRQKSAKSKPEDI